jgi:hypothetical protein
MVAMHPQYDNNRVIIIINTGATIRIYVTCSGSSEGVDAMTTPLQPNHIRSGSLTPFSNKMKHSLEKRLILRLEQET